MAYDDILAERMRPLLLPRPGMTEKKMFGGVGFLLYGTMVCGIWKDTLIIRLSHDDAAKTLQKPHVRIFDITGKPMKGWLLVEPAGFKKDADLLAWIEQSFAFAASLPKK